MTNDPATIAKSLTEAQRNIVQSLCGNAWQGEGRPTPGIAIMNGLGLMHIDALKTKTGEWERFKAKPTPLGLAVRAILMEQQDNG